MTSIHHNAENRPVRWTNAATETVITMTFDSQGRRTEYKSVTNGVQNTWLRFLYDGYLCIQVLYSNAPYNVFKEFVWDPTEPVATRPLIFRYAPSSLNLFYAFDGNKNVSDVFYRLNSNGIGAHYDYVPFGAVTRTHGDSSASFDIVSLNPFRFSSEYYDSELDLVYYNYRHYSPSLGRFLSRDPIAEQGGLNLYAFVGNRLFIIFDRKGLLAQRITISANQVPVEPGNVRIGFLAKFEKGRLSVSLHLKEGLNFSGRLIAEGESVGMRIVYDERAFSKESFLADEAYLHEKTHFENYKKEYNALVEEFNSYDGKKFTYWGRFCGDCSDKLSSYVVARTALFREKCRVADLILEYNDYTPEQLQYYYNNVLKTGHKISTEVIQN